MPDVLEMDLVIAIDGPSGAGKSSTARAVADALAARYLDTGSMYRALAVWCDRQGIAPSEVNRVAAAAAELPLAIDADPAAFRVRLAGDDVTAELHSPRVSGIVSGYAGIDAARHWLTRRIRELIAEHGRIVVEGRDITTVVAPEAQVRVLLRADAAARIARRTEQLNGAADQATVTAQVVGRDRTDSLTTDFVHPAPGVVLIDSTELSLAQVVDRVLALVPAHLRHPAAR